MSTVNFRLPLTLHEALREFAAQERLSMNQVVVRALEQFMDVPTPSRRSA